MFNKTCIVFLLLLSSLLAHAEGPFHLESGIKKNTLIELYTSEGCSSCPPAEKFLNSLKNKSELWNKWVPVAFHVDYWDYIGWKDEYARKQFGYRQSRYASLKRASTVYTPAFMVNGSGWRRGIFGSTLPETDSLVGNLAVTISASKIKANYKSLKKYNFPLKLNVAILGMDLISHIERGENEGRTSRHEFVVVGFDTENSNDLNWSMKLPKLHFSKVKKYALAVWVSEINNPTPIQVVGGLLPSYIN